MGLEFLREVFPPLDLKNMWIKNLIDDWWNSFEYRGTSSFVLMEKIIAL